MDDSTFGTRDARGNWSPADPIRYPPVVTWPLRPWAAFRWVFAWPGYLVPWNAAYLGIGLAVWLWLTPGPEVTQALAPGWIALVWLRNASLVALFFGAFHLRLYVQKAQGQAFKYNARWPEGKAPRFILKNQTLDNLILSFASGVTIWTAYEVLILWYAAQVDWLSFAEAPVYLGLMILAIPLWRDLHFYLVHRAIHWTPLYRLVHHVHHRNINPGPWSGLAMHPVEHLMYFSCALPYLLLPFHPLLPLLALMHAALSPAAGHAGFDKIVLGEEGALDTHSYAHYLHHKYFECNYADGVVPFDKWFGTFHDGTPEAHAKMRARLKGS